ncbi:MAG TPA: hypothetical protein VGE72_01405 [Azospirillum sp.]
MKVRSTRVEITKVDGDYTQAMEAGRRFCARYRRAMAAMAKPDDASDWRDAPKTMRGGCWDAETVQVGFKRI